ncbi:hypothetical protein [Thiohalomonas denitrificans]|uniref:hypothetical protein n=1 Tax=Thiohalomonas denitrificans TaxID=415747 RepID=UPI0026F2EF6F|nr:hypothetical protein [Thiohalomonas denitrificans]
MALRFSSRPGPRERHLARKWDNPLFDRDRPLAQAEVDEAARLDREELSAFLERFQRLVREAAELSSNEESESVLDLKARLEHAYTEGAGLGGNQQPVMEALLKLIEVVMRAVRAGAGEDPVALRELEDEEQARQVHYRLLEHALVADLMRPDALIGREELAETLLSEEPHAVEAALWLFGPDELRQLREEAHQRLEQLRREGHEATAAWQNLALFERTGEDEVRTR